MSGVQGHAGIAATREALRGVGYLADDGLATAVHLALDLRRPLLLEGEPGVGKTHLAKALAGWRGAELIRLQCYEGIDAGQALYEWEYARQLLALRGAFERGAEVVKQVYAPEFLAERPLLRAIRRGDEAVLLIDELDRADDQLEAFLLEVLSDFTVSIPEIGTIAAEQPPAVILTSNRTRELHDALKRRCLYHWIDYPELEREIEIIQMNASDVAEPLAQAVAGAIRQLRTMGLAKPPGTAEAIDWARAIARLGGGRFDKAVAEATVGWAVKNREDLRLARTWLRDVLGA